MKNSTYLKKITFIVLAVLMNFNISAQDLRFTQAVYNPLTLNPAMMGLNTDYLLSLQYRNQWGAIDNGYSTYSFTALAPVYVKGGDSKLDIGLNVINDVAGAYSNLNISLAAGYNLKVSESSFLNLSFQGAFVQSNLNTDDLTFDEQYVVGSYSADNPNNEDYLNDKRTLADFGFGGMWYTHPVAINLGHIRKMSMFTGASVFHVNTPPNESFAGGISDLSRRYSFQGGFKVEGLDKIDVTPHIYVNSQAGNVNTAVGLLVDMRVNRSAKVTLGGWFRTKDAIAVSAGIEYTMFRLTYSYDVMSVSPVSNSISALQTHEVTLSIKLTDLLGTPTSSADVNSFF